MSESATIYSVERGVATITLNREDNRNAMSADLLNSLGDNIKAAETDDKARVVVLTNMGNTFSAGADLKGSSTEEMRYSLVDIFDLMQQSTKPVVGRIAGHCMGGGVGLAAACDISVVADDCKLGFTEVRIGVAPAIISVVCLPKMRSSDAMELFLSGERIAATRAAEVGLINYAVERDALDEKVSEIVGKLVQGGPKALAASKQLVRRVLEMSQADAFDWTAKLSAELFQSPEAGEGIAAFREKRAAAWVPAD